MCRLRLWQLFSVLNVFFVRMRSFDDGDFDDAEEDEGLDDLENVEDVRSLWTDHLFSVY